MHKAQSGNEPRTLWKRLAIGAQIVLVPCAIFTFVWLAIDRSESLKPKGSNLYLLAAAAALQASLLSFAARLTFSLRALGVVLPQKVSVVIALQSLFYFFIPLSIGTDAARWMKIQARLPAVSRAAVVAAVLFDRTTAAVACLLIGLAALPFVASIRFDVPWMGPSMRKEVLIAAVSLTLLVLLGIVAVLAQRHKQRIAFIWSRAFAGNSCVSLALSFLTQGFTIVAVWSGFRWLGIDLAPANVAFGVTGGALAQVIPISVAGAGPGEVAAGLLSAAAGATTEQAVLLASMVYFCKLIGGIEGGLLEWPPIARRFGN
jgi:hypothetical protein